MNDPDVPTGQVVVGKAIKPAGVHGELQVEIISDVPDRFTVGKALLLDGARRRIQRTSAVHKGRINVKLEGINDRDEAEGFRDKLLTIPKDSVPELPEGTFYHYQIIDMEVLTPGGERLGSIVDVLPVGDNDVYVVRGDEGEVLVPGLEEVVLEVDTKNNRMIVELPDGL